MSSNTKAELTVIIVSYNTKKLTLKCLETLFENTKKVNFKVVVYDNASADGSADAIEELYPHIQLIRSNENLGFAKANNIVAERADTEWLLLLNPDTEVHENAIDNLLDFSRAHPKAGITGGRTVFPDGSLNIASCWKRITLWSAFCHAVGLSTLFRNTEIFNNEAIINWQRNSVRHVDIISGCFFMIQHKLWRELKGFNLKYVMYGEEADMCLRAAKLGYSPMVTPEATIMHLVGASSKSQSSKTILVARARVTLIKDHWSKPFIPIGLALMWLWCWIRVFSTTFSRNKKTRWKQVWAERRTWLKGYQSNESVSLDSNHLK